jgi:hypothetical protein
MARFQKARHRAIGQELADIGAGTLAESSSAVFPVLNEPLRLPRCN